MWTWLRHQLGLSRMERMIDMVDSKISDLTTIVGGIADELPILIGDNDAVIAALNQLLANAANPQNVTTLSPDDQAALNTAVEKLQASKAGLDSVDSKMKAAAASAAPPAPAPEPAPAAPAAPTDGSGATGSSS